MLVETKKAKRNRLRAESKKLEGLKIEMKARETGGQSSSDTDDDRIIKNKNTNLLKRQMSSSESDEDNDKTSKKIKNIDKSYEESQPDAEMREETEEMETRDQEETPAEVDKNDNKTPDARENENSTSQIQADESAQNPTENDENQAEEPTIENEENKIVFIKGRTHDITKINPGRVKQRIEEIAGQVEIITKSRDSLKVTCRSVESKQRLMEAKTLHGYDVSITEPFAFQSRIQARLHARRSARTNRGIIFGVEKEISNEEITASIGIPAERIIKRRGENQIPTEQMIIYFPNEIPTHITYGWKRYRVSVYVPEPTRCYKCQEYGHVSKYCRSKQDICSICAGPHEVKACPKKDSHREEKSAVCPNCTGPHPASYRGCSKFKLAQDIVRTQTIHKISYAQAVKKVNESTQGQKQPPNAEQKNASTDNAVNNAADPKINRTLSPSSESAKSAEGGTSSNKNDHRNDPQPRTHEKLVNNKNYVSRKLVNTYFQATFKVLKTETTKEELIKNIYALIKRLNTLFDENSENQIEMMPRTEGEGRNKINQQ